MKLKNKREEKGMQIYLPYKNFRKCAESLDDEILKKQRKNAIHLIEYIFWKLDKWKKKPKKNLDNHPIFKFWWNNGVPYIPSLMNYLKSINFECFNRKFKIIKLHEIENTSKQIPMNQQSTGYPPCPKRITSGYRIMLLTKNTKFYKHHFYNTYKKNLKIIKDLQESKKKFKFSKFMRLI